MFRKFALMYHYKRIRLHWSARYAFIPWGSPWDFLKKKENSCHSII